MDHRILTFTVLSLFTNFETVAVEMSDWDSGCNLPYEMCDHREKPFIHGGFGTLSNSIGVGGSTANGTIMIENVAAANTALHNG